jgi:hypothetical protein
LLPDRIQQLLADGKKIGLLSYHWNSGNQSNRVLRLPEQAANRAVAGNQ